MYLNKLGIGKMGKLINISAYENIKRRLMDIGFNKGVFVKPVLEGKSMRAYNIKGSIIAIRKEDTSKVEVDL